MNLERIREVIYIYIRTLYAVMCYLTFGSLTNVERGGLLLSRAWQIERTDGVEGAPTVGSTYGQKCVFGTF